MDAPAAPTKGNQEPPTRSNTMVTRGRGGGDGEHGQATDDAGGEASMAGPGIGSENSAAVYRLGVETEVRGSLGVVPWAVGGMRMDAWMDG